MNSLEGSLGMRYLDLRIGYYQAQSLGFAITVVSVLRLAQGVLTQLDL
jgi:hypothetical protein